MHISGESRARVFLASVLNRTGAVRIYILCPCIPRCRCPIITPKRFPKPPRNPRGNTWRWMTDMSQIQMHMHIRLHRSIYMNIYIYIYILHTWTPKVCKRMAFWALFNVFGPSFYILRGVQVRHPKYHRIETISPLIEVHWGV